MGFYTNMAKAMEDFKNGTCNFTDDGKCIQCGECCSNYLPMTEREIRIIKAYIKKNGIRPHSHITPTRFPTLDFTCPFLNGQKEKEKCDIYKVRPLVCQEFICDPEKRKPLTTKDRFYTVDVRETFFGKERSE